MVFRKMDIRQQKALCPWIQKTDELSPNIEFCLGRVLEMASEGS